MVKTQISIEKKYKISTHVFICVIKKKKHICIYDFVCEGNKDVPLLPTGRKIKFSKTYFVLKLSIRSIYRILDIFSDFHTIYVFM